VTLTLIVPPAGTARADVPIPERVSMTRLGVTTVKPPAPAVPVTA